MIRSISVADLSLAVISVNTSRLPVYRPTSMFVTKSSPLCFLCDSSVYFAVIAAAELLLL